MKAESFGPIRQIGYVVEDAEGAARRWLAAHGHGPWTLFLNVALPGRFRGHDTTVRMHVALGYDDRETEIELIQVLSDTPSPYQDASGRRLLGPHHVAWFSDDLARDLGRARERGLQPVFQAGNAATRVAYCESPGHPSMLYEFIEMNDTMRAGLEARLGAARGWDGADPIRPIDLGG